MNGKNTAEEVENTDRFNTYDPLSSVLTKIYDHSITVKDAYEEIRAIMKERRLAFVAGGTKTVFNELEGHWYAMSEASADGRIARIQACFKRRRARGA